MADENNNSSEIPNANGNPEADQSETHSPNELRDTSDFESEIGPDELGDYYVSPDAQSGIEEGIYVSDYVRNDGGPTGEGNFDDNSPYPVFPDTDPVIGIRVPEADVEPSDDIYPRILRSFRDRASARARGFWEYRPSPNAMSDAYAMESVPKPDTVLLHKHYGTRIFFDLQGATSDEAVTHLIAEDIIASGSVSTIKSIFWNTRFILTVVDRLWTNRVHRIVRGRSARQTTQSVYTAVNEAANAIVPGTQGRVRFAFAHVLTRILTYLDLAVFGPTERVSRTFPTWVAKVPDVRFALCVKALRPVFSEVHYKGFAQALGQEVNPTMLGQELVRFMHELTRRFDEVTLTLDRFDQSMAILQRSLIDPKSVPIEIRQMPELRDMGRYANLLAEVFNGTFAATSLDPYRLTEAVRATAVQLKSLPHIDGVSAEIFARHIGFTPIASSKLFKGGVAWTWLDRSPSFSMVEYEDDSTTGRFFGVSEEITLSELRSRAFNVGTFSCDGVRGAARLVSDEISLALFNPDTPPVLRTVGLTPDVADIYALMKADALSVVAQGPKGRVVYSVNVGDRWIMSSVAATDKMVMFDHPHAAFMYMLAKENPYDEFIPQGIKTGSQRDLVPPYQSVIMRGREVRRVVKERVIEPFSFAIAVTDPRSTTGRTQLNLAVPIAPAITRLDDQGHRVVHPDDLPMGYVRDDVFDQRSCDVFTTVTAYLGASQKELNHLAESWFYTFLSDLGKNPFLVTFTQSVVSSAYLRANLDGRTYSYTYTRTVTRAFIAVVMATLVRFNKVRGHDAVVAINALNTTSILPDVTRRWGDLVKVLGSTSSGPGISNPI